jgi:hypothetical protein
VGQVDVVVGGPLAHGRQLAGAPHERSGDGAVIGAVGVDAVSSGHHPVQPQQVGQRFDEVEGRGGRQHHRAAGGTMLGEQRCSHRLHHVDQRGGCLHGCLPHGDA